MTPPRPSNDRRREHGGSAVAALLGTLVVALGAAGVWWANRTEGPATLDPARLIAVERRELLDAVTASGRVEPLARVAVMSRASGILKQLLVDEGDVVTAGQVLAELDREQLQAQLAQDQADLLSAQARVDAARARVDETSVQLADPELAFVRREVERLEQLLTTGDVTERELDDARRANSQVEFRVARVAASLPVLAASVAEAQANLAAARAALDRSETALREATIRCPIDGVVLVRSKEVGDGVSSILTAGGNATQIMTLGDLSEMYVEARVDEVDLGRIRLGQPARITVDAHRGRVLLGEVQRIAPAGSVDGNGIVTFEVRLSVDDPDGLLRPDMTADAKLVLDRREAALALPHSALVRTPDGAWTVLRVVGTGAHARAETTAVEIGLSDGLQTEILSGLGEGDRVLLPDGPPRRAGARP